MKISLLLSIVAATILTGCGNSNPGDSNSSATNNSAAKPLDYGGVIVQAKKSSEGKIDTVALNSALQQFNISEGRYPKTLQELVPTYIPKIPDAPYGYKIVYDADNGEVKVLPQ